jgi:hypothetical protein
MLGMDTNQAKIIELLREVHLIAFKEMERLNLRIAELESQNRQVFEPPTVNPATVNPPSRPKQPEMLNEIQVAEYLNMSVRSVLHERLFRANQHPRDGSHGFPVYG